MSKLRRIASGLVVLLLFLPASASIPTAQWNLHLIQRLRGMNRGAPDVDLDLTFRKLLPYLPAGGDIGFQSVDTGDDGRLFFQAQYALLPRQMLDSTQAELVVEVGPGDAAESLLHEPRFHLVVAIHSELRLFRRIPS